jgi:hypothetical protein
MLFLPVPFAGGFIIPAILTLIAAIVFAPVRPAVRAYLTVFSVIGDLLTMVFSLAPTRTFLGQANFLLRMVW